MTCIRVQYTRATGKRRTYDIDVDEAGTFVILLDGVVLKRGVDMLVKTGVRGRGSEPRDAAIRHAQVAIDYLIGMREEPPRADRGERTVGSGKKAAA